MPTPDADTAMRTTPPAVEPVALVTLPAMTAETLPGGTVLKTYNRCDLPVTGLTIVREGGQAEIDNAAAAGIYSRMMREGSASFRADDIAETLDFNGAWLSTSLTSHHHAIKLFALNSRWDNVLPVITDLIHRPAFDSNAFELHREACAKKLEVSLEKVKFLAEEQAQRSAFGTRHPLARTFTPDDVRAVSRDELLSTAGKWSDAPLTIYLSGHITPHIRHTVAQAFASSGRTATPTLHVTDFTPERLPESRIIHRPGAKQSAVVMTLPAIPRSHPDYLPLHIAVAALGGYFGSRLMLNIREEKGYTYGINAGLLGYLDGAMTTVSAECDNAFVYPLIDEVRAEMSCLATDPPKGAELTRLQQAMSASMLEVLDTPFSIAQYHTTMQCSGLPADYFDNKRTLLASLTPEHIAAAAARYLNPAQLNITIAGDMHKM